jgi:hypothetical protein
LGKIAIDYQLMASVVGFNAIKGTDSQKEYGGFFHLVLRYFILENRKNYKPE